MSDIFISYASPDRLRVKPLAEALGQLGWSIWWDRTILAGKTWDQAIESALAEASCVIVLWSFDSVKSDWVLTEAEEAKRRGILVPALLDDINIPFAFRRVQAASLVGWTGTLPSLQFDELAKAVADVVYGSKRPDSHPKIASGGDPISLPQSAAPVHGPSQDGEPRRAELPRVQIVPNTGKQTRSRDFAQTPGTRYATEVSRLRSRQALVIAGTSVLAVLALSTWYFYRSYHQSPATAGQTVATHPDHLSGRSKRAEFEPGRTLKNAVDGLDYAWIPPGSFTMGCSPGDGECDRDEKPRHEVTITSGFWMGKTEVTAGAYDRFRAATGRGDASSNGDADMPAVMVVWSEAKSYCEWTSLRLPTEAEWEYAARAGHAGVRYGDLDAIAWYADNSSDGVHRVGGKLPNEWGLYDMLGNVFEWVADWYGPDYYRLRPAANPSGPSHGQSRVLRGGSWSGGSQSIRASFRLHLDPNIRLNTFGFRCAGANLP